MLHREYTLYTPCLHSVRMTGSWTLLVRYGMKPSRTLCVFPSFTHGVFTLFIPLPTLLSSFKARKQWPIPGASGTACSLVREAYNTILTTVTPSSFISSKNLEHNTFTKSPSSARQHTYSSSERCPPIQPLDIQRNRIG